MQYVSRYRCSQEGDKDQQIESGLDHIKCIQKKKRETFDSAFHQRTRKRETMNDPHFSINPGIKIFGRESRICVRRERER